MARLTGTAPRRVRVRRIHPPLDRRFLPAVLAEDALAAEIAAAGGGEAVRLALEQPQGAVFHRETRVHSVTHPNAAASYRACQRLVKFLLWSCGGSRLYVDGPAPLVGALREHFRATPEGRFDARFMGEEIYLSPFEIHAVPAGEFPPVRDPAKAIGRHLDGCRIGFDLGASDRKAAAVIDGEVVFSEEIRWDPASVADPEWHCREIMDSLRRAAEHLPRVDAIGGSAAGVYVDNEVRAASLFRSVPRDAFQSTTRRMFHELRAAWGGIPFVVVNDGEVTALAGAMMANVGSLLGLAMGSSLAAGYVDHEGRLTSRLNELAFAPVDARRAAPRDEWSGDRGCGVQYFSQQAVARLLPLAGIGTEPGEPLPERLIRLQTLMGEGDPRAAQVYETIGTYLAYALLAYRRQYDLEHVLLLGRVMTGPGGELIIQRALDVLRSVDPVAAEATAIHVPSERMKRHGQAIAAASLAAIGGDPPGGAH